MNKICNACQQLIKSEYYAYGLIPHPIKFTSAASQSFCSLKCADDQFKLYEHEYNKYIEIELEKGLK